MALVVIVFGTVQALVTGFRDMLVSQPVWPRAKAAASCGMATGWLPD